MVKPFYVKLRTFKSQFKIIFNYLFKAKKAEQRSAHK